MRSLLALLLVAVVACEVDVSKAEGDETVEVEGPDGQRARVYVERSAEDAEAEDAGAEDPFGVCWPCPWGRIGTWYTKGVALTEKQWKTIVRDTASAWCEEKRCQDCVTEETAPCTYDSHEFVGVSPDGTRAESRMYCLCPLE